MTDFKISEDQIAAIFRIRQEIQDKYEEILKDCQFDLLSHSKQIQVTHSRGMEEGIIFVMYLLDIDRRREL